MQTQIQPRTILPGNETRIEVQTETGHWQQPQAVKLRAAFVPALPQTVFNRLILTDRGVPFSPLND